MRSAPYLFLGVFGAMFVILAVLIAAILFAADPMEGTRGAWLAIGAVAAVAAAGGFFGLLFRLPLAERRLGSPHVTLEPASPEPGRPLRVSLVFTPPLPVRIKDAWVAMGVLRVPFSSAIEGAAGPSVERRAFSPDPGTRIELWASIDVPEDSTGGLRLTVYVEIAFWPDWRADLDIV